MIILGDAGINYIGDGLDNSLKEELQELPITLFCIHGNHERRPETVDGYSLYEFHGGMVYRQKKYPHLLFAKDGEVYDFEGHKCIVIGGAYSVDKYYRLAKNYLWFADEQPDQKIKKCVEKKLKSLRRSVDIVLSHTCPLKYLPTEALLPSVDQSAVDKTTEQWLDSIEENIAYHKWFCGHYHINKAVDKMQFLYSDIVPISPHSCGSKIEKSAVNCDE